MFEHMNLGLFKNAWLGEDHDQVFDYKGLFKCLDLTQFYSKVSVTDLIIEFGLETITFDVRKFISISNVWEYFDILDRQFLAGSRCIDSVTWTRLMENVYDILPKLSIEEIHKKVRCFLCCQTITRSLDILSLDTIALIIKPMSSHTPLNCNKRAQVSLRLLSMVIVFTYHILTPQSLPPINVLEDISDENKVVLFRHKIWSCSSIQEINAAQVVEVENVLRIVCDNHPIKIPIDWWRTHMPTITAKYQAHDFSPSMAVASREFARSLGEETYSLSEAHSVESSDILWTHPEFSGQCTLDVTLCQTWIRLLSNWNPPDALHLFVRFCSTLERATNCTSLADVRRCISHDGILKKSGATIYWYRLIRHEDKPDITLADIRRFSTSVVYRLEYINDLADLGVFFSWDTLASLLRSNVMTLLMGGRYEMPNNGRDVCAVCRVVGKKRVLKVLQLIDFCPTMLSDEQKRIILSVTGLRDCRKVEEWLGLDF